MENATLKDKLFGDIKKDTIRRNARRSVKWMFNKIRQAKVTKTLKPVPGAMYLYGYDPKWAEKLPYYDIAPLVIVVDLLPDGFYGLNFHYLRLDERKLLLKLLIAYDSDKKRIPMNYNRLKSLGTIWKHAFKRYLFSHLTTKLVRVNMNEWESFIALPFASFQKATQTQVFKQRKF